PINSRKSSCFAALPPSFSPRCRRTCCRHRRRRCSPQKADDKVYNLIQLIYRAKNYEGPSKDYEFSRRTMEEHWRAGYNDAVRTLRHPEVLQRPDHLDGVFTFDLAYDGRE